MDSELYQPQRQHLLKLADALLVCEDEKTLAAWQRQFVCAPDASNLAAFLRLSPWQADELRAALRRSQVQWLLALAEQTGAERVIYLNIDDALGEQDQATRRVPFGCAPVDWQHDPSESTKSNPRDKNAFCSQACTLCVGEAVATVDLRLYLREKTVRRLNRPAARLSQQISPGSCDVSRRAALVAARVEGLRAVRQLVRRPTLTQVCSPPRLADDLRSQVQSQTRRHPPRPARSGTSGTPKSV